MKRFRTVGCLSILLIISVSSQAQTDTIHFRLNSEELQIDPVAIPGSSSNDTARIIASTIIRKVLAAKAKEEGIVVPEPVLSKCLELYFAASGASPQDVDKLAEKEEAIAEALKQVVVHHEPTNRVYDQHLAGVIRPAEWAVWVKGYNTSEKVRKLEALIPHSVAAMKANSKPELERSIQTWMLFQRVCKPVTPSAVQVLSQYKNMYPSGVPPFSEVEAAVRNRVIHGLQAKCLANWWQVVLAQQTIEIPPSYRK